MEQKIGLVQPQATDLASEELAAVEKLQKGYHNMKSELGKVIVGQEAVIEELLIALFCRGHALLVGVPGLAKTLMISTLSKTLGLSFNRIQFTPDLMPQPFFVLATQNPIEQEGTYPLPEAQLDRFMFNIHVGYPSEEEEFQIVRLTTAGRTVN